MDEEIAQKLLDELGKHRSIVRPNNQLFLDILLSTDVSESSRFHEALPDRSQFVEENGFYYSLSLRRILRNKNAQNYQPLLWKKADGSIASALGFYSSDALSRNLRSNKDSAWPGLDFIHWPSSRFCFSTSWAKSVISPLAAV